MAKNKPHETTKPRCWLCKRPLTSPLSIKRMFGPKCDLKTRKQDQLDFLHLLEQKARSVN